ncbi:MAG: leucyl/phenylalanyl-tRNA--protein transferase [Pseudomonadota bacterium]|nr:leucyl/phenylalanyl-tRNA--protein transferase [Pseudomonadota bacterium]HJO36097.1 leucyl/phenylalanyl-tRNA--protein transferase [Gammaproteobacteria bacterium]
MTAIPWLDPAGEPRFPPTARARRDINGLLAAGGALREPWLLAAYRRGIFPWFNEGEPTLWWAPDPRAMFVPGAVHASRRLRRRLRQDASLRLSFDRCFEHVVDRCAAPRDGHSETWLGPQMRRAYLELHRAGHAHSVEVWAGGRLIGGLYGPVLGGAFFGESMFSAAADGSKIALLLLSEQLYRWDFTLLDCQLLTPHLARLGAREIPRTQFERQLALALARPPVARWRFDADLAEPRRHFAAEVV